MRYRLATGLLALAAIAAALPLRAAAAGEPSGFAYFHTYAEAVAAIDQAVADYPNLAQKFSIGDSYQGRPIWGLMLTADVANGGQGRPEVVIDSLMHARERASLEMSLYMVGALTYYYGRTGTDFGRRVTRLLDTTVVYVLPVLNPDGAVYDFKGGVFHKWRKNRQPIPNSTEIGIDLNRNFRFMWGCCGGSSANPAKEDYRGPSYFYAPEVVAYRDFIKSHPGLTEALSIHSAASRVLWPYGYTVEDVPDTMAVDDHSAMVALAQGIGQRDGFPAQQSSDMYVSDGDGDDWTYHSQGVFRLTLELSAGSRRRYYPSLSELNADIARNKRAILWYLEQAACPFAPAGLQATYCATSTASGVQSMSLAEGKRTARLASAGRSTD
jgi:carboxypeptidase T